MSKDLLDKAKAILIQYWKEETRKQLAIIEQGETWKRLDARTRKILKEKFSEFPKHIEIAFDESAAQARATLNFTAQMIVGNSELVATQAYPIPYVSKVMQ